MEEDAMSAPDALAELLKHSLWYCAAGDRHPVGPKGFPGECWENHELCPEHTANDVRAFLAERVTREKVVKRIAGVLIPYLEPPEPATGSRQQQALFVAGVQADAILALIQREMGGAP